MCVLLVEDDDLIRIGLTELLIDAGFEVLEAPNAEAALQLTGTVPPPRLLVSDVNLGRGMDGFALASAARRRWPDLPVLLMSGLGSNFADRRCGAAELFLSKPFSFVSFLHTVIQLAGQPTLRPV